MQRIGLAVTYAVIGISFFLLLDLTPQSTVVAISNIGHHSSVLAFSFLIFLHESLSNLGLSLRQLTFVPLPSSMPQTLDYGCTDWRLSSQRAADLYNSGIKLWTKEDLKDIEQQLAQSYTLERFSVRRIDGTIIQISNPMFQVENPIWYVDIDLIPANQLTFPEESLCQVPRILATGESAT